MTQGYDVRKIESPLLLYCIKSQLIILLEVLYESFLRTENHLTEHVNLVSSQVFFLNLRKNVKIYRSTKVIHPKYYNKYLKIAAKHSHLGR